jgi:hypothetical protein
MQANISATNAYGRPIFMSLKKKYSDRGFAQFGDELLDENGSVSISVYESSRAFQDCCWLKLDGEAHVHENEEITIYSPGGYFGEKIGYIPPTRLVKCWHAAHLDLKRAKDLRDRLDAWIKEAEGRR